MNQSAVQKKVKEFEQTAGALVRMAAELKEMIGGKPEKKQSLRNRAMTDFILKTKKGAAAAN